MNQMASQRASAPQGLTVTPETRVTTPFYYEPTVSLGSALLWANCRFGRGSYINDGVLRENTTVGRYCSIGRRVTIGAPNHSLDLVSTAVGLITESDAANGLAAQPHEYVSDTHIGNDAWIAENVVIIGGLKIGDGAAIGASSVVTHDVPPFAIVAGVPARIIRYRFDEPTRERLLESAWWECAHEYLVTLPLRDINATLDRLERDRPPKDPVQYIEVGAPAG